MDVTPRGRRSAATEVVATSVSGTRIAPVKIVATMVLLASAVVPVAAASAAPAYVPGEVLVGYDTGTSATVRAQVRAEVKGRDARRLSPKTPSAETITVPAGANMTRTLTTLRRNPAVRYAEPNWIVQPTAVSNDPLVIDGSLWGMTTTFGSQASAAWAFDTIGSPTVSVGIIDEGVDISHPDLAANIWTNQAEAAGVTGVDDDANGYVDDINGWDFVNNDKTVYDGGNLDRHGTHVAGTIGGVGGNGIGVAGVNWNVKMIPVKFLGATGGSIANAIKALDYLTDLKVRRGVNVVASNNSWGGGGFSQGMLDAINRSGDAGMLFVAAAGNGGLDGVGDNNDSFANYPSNYQCTTRFDTKVARGHDCVVAVASITSTGARSSFSNYGKTMVDLGAPGSNIFSTLPNSTYGSFSGTSMATPHVTGALALCSSVNPTITPANERAALIASVTPTTSLATITASGGRLDVNTLRARCAGTPLPPPPPPPPPPAAPGAFVKLTPVTATTGLATRVTVTWAASTGVTNYEVCADTTNDNACTGAWTRITGTSAAISGRARTTYYWQVRAVNAGGTTVANGGTWWSFTTR